MQLSHILLIDSSYDQKNVASSAKVGIVKGENKEKKIPKGTSKRMREDRSYIFGRATPCQGCGLNRGSTGT